MVGRPHPLTDAALQVPERSRPRLPELDGLRGIAILLVLVWHLLPAAIAPAPPAWQHAVAVVIRFAWSGVDLFFVLSGFLIGGTLLDERDSPRYFRTFYARRAYRILPLYAVMVALFAILRVVMNDAAHAWLFTPAMPLATYVTFTQNIAMARAGAFGAQWLGPTWSLAIEEQFYLVLPLVLRLVPRSRVLLVVTGLAVAAPLVRWALVMAGASPMAPYVLMPARADALMVGVLAAYLWRRRDTIGLARRRPQLYAAAAVLAAAIVVLALLHEAVTTPHMTRWGYSVLALFYGVVLLLALPSGHDDGLRRALRLAPLRFTGRIAYALYLLHLPMWGLVAPLVPSQPLGVTAGLAATFAIATASWYRFEAPLVARGHRHRY